MRDIEYSVNIIKEELNAVYICPEVEYAFKASIEALEEQLRRRKWIPVGERLPGRTGLYLVTTEINYYHGGYRDTNDDTTDSIAIAYYNGTGKIGESNCWSHSNVIAWRLLPETYKPLNM